MAGLAYAYYPGCSLVGTAREYDISTRLVCQALGIELRELEDWTCCGASSAHNLDHLLSIALPAHELKGAQEMGLTLAVVCAMCFSRLKFTLKALQDSATLAQVNQIVGAKLDNKVVVEHLLTILESKVKDLPVKKPLTGLKVACYYGCLLARPQEVIEFGDNDENPQSMDRLMTRIGAECVDWAFKAECCGANFPFAHPEVVVKLSGRILSQARQAGADCLVVACPMCHNNLDVYQRQMKAQGLKADMPIIYFTQLLGLALGFSPQQLHLDKHFTDPLPLLREKSLI